MSNPTTNLSVVVTPKDGKTLVMGYERSYPGPVGAVPGLAHKDALLYALSALAAEGADPTDAYFSVCEYVASDGEHGGYYREVVTLDYAEVLEAIRTDGASVVRTIRRVIEAEWAEKAGTPVKVDARGSVVSADGAAKGETFVDLTPAGPAKDVRLEADTPGAFSRPDTFTGHNPNLSTTATPPTLAELIGLVQSLGRRSGGCGKPTCPICQTFNTVSADAPKANGVKG